jgi:hypothetical protein
MNSSLASVDGREQRFLARRHPASDRPRRPIGARETPALLWGMRRTLDLL